jgi:hypothetical protein
MVYLQTTYELCFGEAYFEYFELCDFSRENTNIDVDVSAEVIKNCDKYLFVGRCLLMLLTRQFLI